MEPEEHIAGPVSPELVLVDPKLASAARATLPEHPWPAPVRIEPRPRHQRSGVPGAGILWTLTPGLVLLLVVFGLTLVSTGDRPTFAAEGVSSPAASPARTTERASRPVAPQTTRNRSARAERRPKRAATPRAETRPPRVSARARSTRRSAPPRISRAIPPRFSPARTFSWPPHTNAAYYQVTFLRNGGRFYRTRARAALIRLPERVRFTTGVYRWSVRPAIATELGIRLGPPIVDSTFRVSGE